MDYERIDRDVKEILEFTGLKNTVDDEALSVGDLTEAVNVDITNGGKIRRRSGMTIRNADAAHSLWSNDVACIYVDSTGSLKRLNEDYSSTTISNGYGDSPMSYESIGDKVFFTNSILTGIYDSLGVRKWGIEPPIHQPTAQNIGGSLQNGTYLFAVTYVRLDGTESGTGVSGTIEVTEGGIGFSNIPVSLDPFVTNKNLYISPVNGDKLFLQAMLTNTETVAVYANYVVGSKIIETQFLSPPPAGHLITYYNGSMYVAFLNYVFVSSVYGPELFDLRMNFPFESNITMLKATEDGVYVSTKTAIYFMSGDKISELKITQKATYGAIQGTACYGDADDTSSDQAAMVIYFATTKGLCIAQAGGIIKNITGDKFLYPIQRNGAGLVRRNRKVNQYIAFLRGVETPVNIDE